MGVTITRRRITMVVVVATIAAAASTWLIVMGVPHSAATNRQPGPAAVAASVPANVPALSQTQKAGGTEAVSNGDTTTAHLDQITVSASAGSIAAGQSLTVGKSGIVRDDVGSVLSLTSAFTIATSQNQPTGPVSVIFTFDRAQFPRSHDYPLLLHQEEPNGPWLPELGTLSADGTSVTAVVTHFSQFDWVDTFDYAFGLLSGNRTDADVEGCGPAPSWVTPVILPMPIDDLNAAVWACPDSASTEETLQLHVVNNRGYAELLSVSGATVESATSQWGPTSLEQAFGQAVAAAATATARLATGTTNTIFVAGGSSVTLALNRPAPGLTSTPTSVTITAGPSQAAVAADMMWAAIQLLADKVKVGADVINCVFTATQFATNTQDDPLVAYDLMSKCVGTLLDVGEAFTPVDAVITADGVAQKLNDAYIDDKYPAHLLFTLTPSPPTTKASAAPSAVEAATLGGLDLNAYCISLNFTGVHLLHSNVAGWRCATSSGDANINIDDACARQYGPEARSKYTSYADPNSWVCYKSAEPTTTNNGDSIDLPATTQTLPTGVQVKTGQHVRIVASGQTTYGSDTRQGCVGDPIVTPDGTRRIPSGPCPTQLDPACQAPDFPVGSVLARIGSGPWRLIGLSKTFVAAGNGELILGYNDRYWQDNAGAYQTRISISP